MNITAKLLILTTRSLRKNAKFLFSNTWCHFLRKKNKPRILILNPTVRVIWMLFLCDLLTDSRISFTSLNKNKWGKLFGNRFITAPDLLDMSKLQCCIIGHNDLRPNPFKLEYSFLAELGVKKECIFHMAQPGKILSQLKTLRPFSVDELQNLCYKIVYHDVFLREHYGYGVMLATEQAKRLDIQSVTIVEAGVWRGAGLLNLCEWCDFFNQTLGMKYKVVGFDTGVGMPPPKDWRDHPELWQEGGMIMPSMDELRSRLPEFCELILGNVEHTVPNFLDRATSYKDSPIGFLSLDVDHYTSTVHVLKLLETKAENLLPATIVWVDDSYINIMHSKYSGEALAINEFNKNNSERKIDQKIIRTNRQSEIWHHGFWFAHIFDHPVRKGERMSGRLGGYFHGKY